MSLDVLKGAVDQSVEVRVLDSTDGTPEAAFAFDTAGIALWYRREGGAKVAITPADLAALTTAHTDGGVKYISDGYVRIDVPDAAFATGATSVVIGGSATGMVIVAARVNLVSFNPQDAVRLGLTALPNAAADAAGGLPISDAGGLDLDNRMPSATAVGNINIVYATDFAANYDTTGDCWMARLDNGVTHGGNTAVLQLERIIVTATTSNEPAVSLVGNGSGAGLTTTGGATGAGFTINGGATSGNAIQCLTSNGHALWLHAGGADRSGLSVDSDNSYAATFSAAAGGILLSGAEPLIISANGTGPGVSIVTSDGHGIQISAAGANKHGIVVTGGDSGTCDGLKAVAGTGGVPIRGDITGNITGNLSGSAGSVTGAVGSVTGAVGSVTGNVGGNVAGSVASVTGAVGSVTGNVGGNVAGSVASVTGNVGGNVVGSVGSLAAQAKADVNAEVLDVVATDTPVDGRTIVSSLQIIGAGVAGRVSGAGTGTETFKGFDESTTRIVITVDGSGNRTDIVYS